jgi:hypothetical protein
LAYPGPVAGRDRVASVAVVLGLVVPSFRGASGGSSAARSGDANVIDGSYIVVYKGFAGASGRRTAALESELGFRADYIHAAAIDGFAARLKVTSCARSKAIRASTS